MKEVYFGDENSLIYGLIPISQEIPLFKPRIYTISVPGMDGSYDITDRMGLHYDDAQIKLKFESKEEISEVRSTLRQLNGQRFTLKIMDPRHIEAYDGRISSIDVNSNNSTCTVDMIFVASARGATYV